MSKIEIVCENNTIAQIELREHPFVEKWFKHWEFINNNFPVHTLTYQYPINLNNSAPSIELVKEAIDCIKIAATYLDSITNKFKFPYDLNNFPSYDVFLENGLEAQLHLNRFHRYFTTGVRNPYTEDLIETGMIKNYEDVTNWLARIQEINQAVHKLDHATKTPHLNNSVVLDCLDIQYSLYNKDMFLSQGTHCSISEEECLSLADDSNEWDVWMGVDLLGKDYMTGFINHDDPTEWDLQYLNTYTGMFMVYQDKTPVDFCKSEAFNDWLREYGMEYDARMCGIPIGKTTFKHSRLDVVDGKNIEIREA